MIVDKEMEGQSQRERLAKLAKLKLSVLHMWFKQISSLNCEMYNLKSPEVHLNPPPSKTHDKLSPVHLLNIQRHRVPQQ